MTNEKVSLEAELQKYISISNELSVKNTELTEKLDLIQNSQTTDKDTYVIQISSLEQELKNLKSSSH